MGDAMRSVTLDALSLIQELRSSLEEAPPILTTEDDANYFEVQKTLPSKEPVKQKAQKPLPKISSPQKPNLIATPNPTQNLPDPTFRTSPLDSSISPTLPSLKSLFAKIAPELPLLEKIPSDAFAKKIAARWKTKNQIAPISILSLNEPSQQKALLHEIAQALDIYFGPAKIISAESIERDKEWDAFLTSTELKFVIACDYTLWQLSSLMPFYRENTSNGTRTLKQVPLFLLPDLSLYLKDPLLKRSLWKALCQKLT